MAKQHGLGAGLLVGGADISGDIGAVSRIASPRTVLDLTDITQEAFERALAYKDGAIEFQSWFNPAAGRAHPTLSALPREDTAVTYLHRRATQNAMAASMVAKQITYDADRQQDGSLSFSTSSQANLYGLEWGNLLSEGVQTFTAADESASVDNGAATAFGLQAYLHVTAFTGTNVTFAIQSSSDNGAGDAWAAVTGATFTANTGVGWERLQTARALSIERYLRVVATGTFSSVTFTVNVVRNAVTVNF
jgi:hypothetical protein